MSVTGSFKFGPNIQLILQELQNLKTVKAEKKEANCWPNECKAGNTFAMSLVTVAVILSQTRLSSIKLSVT